MWARGNHIDLLLHTHSGFFESLAILSVHDGVGGEVVHAGEAHLNDLSEEVPHAATRVGGMNSANDGDFFDDREDFKFPNLHCDGIGITIGHESGCRSGACHAEAPRIVDDDEVGSAFLDEFGRDPGPGAGSNNGLPPGQSVVQAFKHFLSRVGVSHPCPWIRHNNGNVKIYYWCLGSDPSGLTPKGRHIRI